MNFLKASVVLISLFFFSFFNASCSYPPVNVPKIALLLSAVKSQENRHEHFISRLYHFNSETRGSMKYVQRSIRNEYEYFIALKYAINYNFKGLLSSLLNWKSPFSYDNDEIDVFMLCAIADLKATGLLTEKNTELVKYLFSVNLRVNNQSIFHEIDETSFNMGTFSSIALSEYLKHLFTMTNELFIAYPIYREHFLTIPEHLTLEFDHLSPNINWKISDLLQVFDLLLGYTQNFPFNEDGASALGLLTYLNIADYRLISETGIDCIEAAIKHFLLNSRINNNFFTIYNWNLCYAPFKKCFHSVFNDDLNSAIFHLIINALETHCHLVSWRSNLFHALHKIRFLLEPIENLQFIRDLVIKIIKFAVGDLNSRIHSAAIMNLPVVIDFLMEECEGLFEQFDFQTIPEIFNANGSLNYFMYWLFAHNSKLFSCIQPEMVSLHSTICPLFSFNCFLVPHLMNYRIDTNSFQKLLFSHVKDPKSILQFFLHSDPRGNFFQIQAFFDYFRGESDFELISNLSEIERKERCIVIDIVSRQSVNYIYASVYKINLEDSEEMLIGQNRSLTLLAKIILGIIF